MQRTRNGVYKRQITEYPRGAYTQRSSHQSIHGSPACGVYGTRSTSVKARSTRGAYTRSLHATGLTQVKSGVTRVLARYGVHASRSTDYPRGARATKSTLVHPRITSGSKGYIGPLNEHTYRSNFFSLNLAFFSLNLSFFSLNLGLIFMNLVN